MPRTLAQRPRARLEAAVPGERVVEVLGCPGRIEALDLHVVAVQKLPRGPGGAARGVADLAVVDDGVGVIDEGNVVSQVVTSKVLGSVRGEKTCRSASDREVWVGRS